MPRPSLRSTSNRKVKRTTPGGKRVVHYTGRKGRAASCSVCKKPLHGAPKGTTCTFRNLTKSQKRPERPFGGTLCSSCMRREVKSRKLDKFGY